MHIRRRHVEQAAPILASSLVLLAGVLFLHWNVFGLVLVFWLETVIVIVAEALRAMLAPLDRGASRAERVMAGSGQCLVFLLGACVMLVPVMFLGHKELGGFAWTGSVVDDAVAIARTYGLALPFLALVVVHAANLVSEVARGIEYQGPLGSMFRWFAFIVMFLLAGIPAVYFGANLWVLVVLIAVKAGLELVMIHFSSG